MLDLIYMQAEPRHLAQLLSFLIQLSSSINSQRLLGRIGQACAQHVQQLDPADLALLFQALAIETELAASGTVGSLSSASNSITIERSRTPWQQNLHTAVCRCECYIPVELWMLQ